MGRGPGGGPGPYAWRTARARRLSAASDTVTVVSAGEAARTQARRRRDPVNWRPAGVQCTQTRREHSPSRCRASPGDGDVDRGSLSLAAAGAKSSAVSPRPGNPPARAHRPRDLDSRLRPNRGPGIPSPFPGQIGNGGNGNWGFLGLQAALHTVTPAARRRRSGCQWRLTLKVAHHG